MCQSIHTNFFHRCGHEQLVLVPSLNPTCQRKRQSFKYFEDKYCPRCSWKGRLFPFVIRRLYEELGPGIPCGGLTGDVMRTVRFPWYPKYNYTKETLWVERRAVYSQVHMFLFEQVEEEVGRIRALPEELALNRQDRLYLLRGSRPGHPNTSPQLYVPLTNYLDMIQEERDTCPICHGRTNLGTGHEDSCQGSDYVDAAGNRVGGEPVFIPCEHVFGLGCIRPWMEEPTDDNQFHDNCPVCREEFRIIRQAPYQEPENWDYEELSVRDKIDYNLQYAQDVLEALPEFIWAYLVHFSNYPWVLVEEYQEWFEDIRLQTLRLQQWREVLDHDWNNLSVWPGLIMEYYVIMLPLCLLSSAPFWMSWTNILLATFGAQIWWWVRPRPFGNPDLDTTKKYKRYIWFAFAGNFIEWMMTNNAGGLFFYLYGFFLAAVYFGFIFVVLTQNF